MSDTFQNLNRYQMIPTMGGHYWTVRDTETDQLLTGPEGSKLMTQRDAHDLREEYRWS